MRAFPMLYFIKPHAVVNWVFVTGCIAVFSSKLVVEVEKVVSREVETTIDKYSSCV